MKYVNEILPTPTLKYYCTAFVLNIFIVWITAIKWRSTGEFVQLNATICIASGIK